MKRFVMDISELDKLSKELGFSFEISEGDKQWAMIKTSQDALVGKLIFTEGELIGWKCYKKHYIRELCEADKIWFRLECFIMQGRIITNKQYNRLVEEAKRIQQKDLADKIAWRIANPRQGTNRRKRLQGRNVRFVLRELILEGGTCSTFQSLIKSFELNMRKVITALKGFVQGKKLINDSRPMLQNKKYQSRQ